MLLKVRKNYFTAHQKLAHSENEMDVFVFVLVLFEENAEKQKKHEKHQSSTTQTLPGIPLSRVTSMPNLVE